MAERQLTGKYFFLFRGNGEDPTETFDVFACTESTGIAQSSSELSAETNCGILTAAGAKQRSVSFTIIPVASPGATKVPIDTLQADFDNGDLHNYKITPASSVAGDPLFSFSGYLSELNWDFSASDFVKGSGTIKITDAGIQTDIDT